MGGEMPFGKCQCCGKDNVPLYIDYFRYPGIKCECCSPNHFIRIEHCKDCIPKEPRETKIVVKTKDLKNPIVFAMKIIEEQLKNGLDGSIYIKWKIELASEITKECNVDRDTADKVAENFLNKLFLQEQ